MVYYDFVKICTHFDASSIQVLPQWSTPLNIVIRIFLAGYPPEVSNTWDETGSGCLELISGSGDVEFLTRAPRIIRTTENSDKAPHFMFLFFHTKLNLL